jgi:hypothetical protein
MQKTGLVTGVIPGHAGDCDEHKFKKLIDKDLSKSILVPPENRCKLGG